MILIISAVSKFLLEIHLFLCFKHSLKLQVSNVFSKKKMVLRPSPSLRKSRCLTIADRAIAIFEIIAKSTSLTIIRYSIANSKSFDYRYLATRAENGLSNPPPLECIRIQADTLKGLECVKRGHYDKIRIIILAPCGKIQRNS